MSEADLTLSSLGKVTTIADRVNKALEYFYVAQYSQTSEYRGMIMPLSYITFKYGDDAEEYEEVLKDQLTVYLNNLFDLADVECETETVEDRIHARVNIVVTHGGQAYNVGHLIRSHNLKVMDVFDYVNDGVVIKGKQP